MLKSLERGSSRIFVHNPIEADCREHEVAAIFRWDRVESRFRSLHVQYNFVTNFAAGRALSPCVRRALGGNNLTSLAAGLFSGLENLGFL